jgi:hypothetical protein
LGQGLDGMAARIGEKRFIEDDEERGIRRDLVNRVRRILTALLSVENVEGLEGPPG